MFLVMLWGCGGGTYDRFEPLIDCTSVTTDSNGVTITEVYDAWGWPTLVTYDDGVNPPVETVIGYQRVAGAVREARHTTGEVVLLETFDGSANLRDAVTNLFGVEDIVCTNTYEGDTIATSVCNEVTTTYDPCGRPLEVSTPHYAEAFTNTYVRCQPQGTTVDGLDARGSYSRNVQYDAEGRFVSETLGRDGQTSSKLTEWTCPPRG